MPEYDAIDGARRQRMVLMLLSCGARISSIGAMGIDWNAQFEKARTFRQNLSCPGWSAWPFRQSSDRLGASGTSVLKLLFTLSTRPLRWDAWTYPTMPDLGKILYHSPVLPRMLTSSPLTRLPTRVVGTGAGAMFKLETETRVSLPRISGNNA